MPPRLRTADVVVVGAGVVGLSVAVHLRWQGASVIVLERGRIGDQTSSRGFGIVSAQLRRPASYLRLMLAAQVYFPELVARLDCPNAYRVSGSLTLLRDEAELAARRALIDEQRKIPDYDPGEILAAQDVRRLEPALDGDFLYAQHRPLDGQVEPVLLLDGLRRAAQREGATLVQGAAALATVRDRDAWRIDTPVGPFAAPIVVNSAGVWATEVGRQAGVTIPVRSVRGQIVVLRERAPILTATLGWAGVTDIRQALDGRVWLGTVAQADSWDLRVRADDTKTILERASAIVTALADDDIDEAWAALRPVPFDGLPLVGAIADQPGYFVAVGHGGLSFCGVEGRGLARQIVRGEVDPLLEPFRPDRQVPADSTAVTATIGTPLDDAAPELVALAAQYGLPLDAADWNGVARFARRYRPAATSLVGTTVEADLRSVPPRPAQRNVP